VGFGADRAFGQTFVCSAFGQIRRLRARGGAQRWGRARVRFRTKCSGCPWGGGWERICDVKEQDELGILAHIEAGAWDKSRAELGAA
jgi:hypothetical protein